MINTGLLIKKRRKELGINADYIANKLGVSRSTIFRYENGEIEKMPITILEPLSKILNTTPAYLMGWEENKIEENIVLTDEEIELITKLRKINPKDFKAIKRFINTAYANRSPSEHAK